MHISYTKPNTKSIITSLQETLHYLDPDSPRLVDILWLHRQETLNRDTVTRRYRTDNHNYSVKMSDMLQVMPSVETLVQMATEEYATHLALHPGSRVGVSIHDTDHVYRILLTLDSDVVHEDSTIDVKQDLVALLCIGNDDVLVATGVGERCLVEAFVGSFKEYYTARRFIKYDHLLGYGQSGPIVKSMSLNEEETKRWIGNDAFYPFIEGGIEQLAKDFNDNRASVLLLMGIRGTGKTTLVRTLNVLLDRDSNVICNDEQVIGDPNFMPYVHSLEDGVTISIEDADMLCSAREDGNRQMSSLLSFADGVVHTNSKLIIATNLTNLNKVDEALVRKGRTYKVIQFRRLTPDEANAARASIGKDPIDDYGVQSVTLGDALTWEEGDNATGTTSISGFH